MSLQIQKCHCKYWEIREKFLLLYNNIILSISNNYSSRFENVKTFFEKILFKRSSTFSIPAFDPTKWNTDEPYHRTPFFDSFRRLTYYREPATGISSIRTPRWFVGIKNRRVRAFRGARRARGTTMAGIRTKWRCLCEGPAPKRLHRRGFLPRWNPRNTFTYALGPLKCNSRPSAALSFLSGPHHRPPLPRSVPLWKRSAVDKPANLPSFVARDQSSPFFFIRPEDIGAYKYRRTINTPGIRRESRCG